MSTQRVPERRIKLISVVRYFFVLSLSLDAHTVLTVAGGLLTGVGISEFILLPARIAEVPMPVMWAVWVLVLVVLPVTLYVLQRKLARRSG